MQPIAEPDRDPAGAHRPTPASSTTSATATTTGPRLGRALHPPLAVRREPARRVRARPVGASKIMPMLLLAAMCLPALVIVAAIVVTGADELVADYTSVRVNLQLVIAIFVAAQAPRWCRATCGSG